MPKLTEADLDAAINYRAPARYKATRPQSLAMVWNSADPTQNFGGPQTEPFERDHAPMTLHGVEVQPMPAEASTEVGAQDRKPRRLLSPAGLFWVPYALIGVLLGAWWALRWLS